MFLVIWEFEPNPGRVADFEAVYGPQGDWAQLFGRSPEYLGTELLRDTAHESRYLTIDRWASREGFELFERRHHDEYQLLDGRCEALTRQEVLIGRFQFP